jgi:hypothetical protein
MSGLFDECLGQADADPRVAEGLVRRVVGRIERMVDRGVLPKDSPYAQIAQIQDSAAERAELMLWTAPPRHESAIEVGAVRTSHDSKEPGNANDYDRRSRYREVSVSGSWH